MSESVETAPSRIEEGIEAVKQSDRFREYLAFCARFHKYSFANQILIWTQQPQATHVAGFHTWLNLGRHVRKGEKGIQIFAPMKVRAKNVENKTDGQEGKTSVFFRLVYVFDVGQTEGEDLPSPNQRLTGDDAGIWTRLSEVTLTEGIGISRDRMAGQTANGFYIRSEHCRRMRAISDVAMPLRLSDRQHKL